MLDPLAPDLLRPLFNDIFTQLQRGKALEPFVFHQGAYLVSLDGGGSFSSKKIHGDSCLQKKNHQSGEITYQHQMLGAAIVHPDHQQVIQLAREAVSRAETAGRVTTLRWTRDDKKETVTCEIRFTHDLPLNQSNVDLRVNFLQYTESAPDGSIRQRFSWVTDLKITPDNAPHLVRGGRARWKIENETFHTLKNQRVLLRAQLWAWSAAFVGGLGDADDVGVSSGPNAGTVLSVVSSGSCEAGQPPFVVGPCAFALPPQPAGIDAATSGSDPLRLGQGDASSQPWVPLFGASPLSRYGRQPSVLAPMQVSHFFMTIGHVGFDVCADLLANRVSSNGK
ncbi:MAG: hypothetical protein QGF59_21125 [Pirellulaceae bacterium]|nr:hypothetical protein [Pirellulaceae bacterium]